MTGAAIHATLHAKTQGQNRLGLWELCEQYANEDWVAVHMTNGQAAESVLECFRRAVMQELQLLELECKEG